MGEISNEKYKKRKKEEIDYEWVELIEEALQMGLTKEEIRAFLKSNGSLEHHDNLVKSCKVSGI
jgi:DNA-binding transcriptional regulator YhcF (GntR family)